MIEEFPLENNDYENANDKAEEIRKPTIAQVSALYSFGVILLLYIGSRAQRVNVIPWGILITEFILILIPSLALLLIYKYNIMRVLRLNKISFLNSFIVMCIAGFAIPVVTALNLVNLMVIKSLFGKVILPATPMPGGSYGLLISILAIGAAPGICEEIMFRGVILRGFERYGIYKGILITAFLFGLMHLDFQKLLGTFLLGALIGFVVYRTNSIFAGMIAHFTNNSAIVLLTYGLGKLQEIINKSGLDKAKGFGSAESSDKAISTLMNLPRAQLIAVLVFYGFIFLFFLAGLVGLIMGLIKNTSVKNEKVSIETRNVSKKSFLWLAPGLLLIAFIYLAKGFSLGGIHSILIKDIARLIGLT